MFGSDKKTLDYTMCNVFLYKLFMKKVKLNFNFIHVFVIAFKLLLIHFVIVTL